MNKLLFILSGSAGCYDDRRDWIVAIFETAAEAEKAKKLIVDWFKAHPRPTFDELENPALVRKASCPYDPPACYSLLEEPDYGVGTARLYDLETFSKRRRPRK